MPHCMSLSSCSVLASGMKLTIGHKLSASRQGVGGSSSTESVPCVPVALLELGVEAEVKVTIKLAG